MRSGAQPSYARGTIFGLRPGQVLDGRFAVGELIGYGGQGVVLKVRHLEWGVDLALKLPLPEVVRQPVNRERYLQEAETWIRLGVHPNVVRCWFVHKVSGLPGLFLDLVTGGSVEDKIKSGELGPGRWQEILVALLQIAEGLAHSHSMGVVHRDVKPENLLVRADGAVCLTDFGLVKTLYDSELDSINTDLDAPTEAGVTGTGQFVGTPRYGAPEQWNKSMAIGPATDIYALGVVFYEMLCGRRPFDGPDENVDVLTLIHRHLSSAPPDPRTFAPKIPEPLAELCLHCLAKDPKLRPPTAAQLGQLLAKLLQEICGQDYQKPASVPGGDRADLLNNAAVSLYSLGKVKKSRELLQQGLLLEAGHPECLYNFVQIERRQGNINAGDSLRQLRRAKARFPLALLCIEEGLGKQAQDLLAVFTDHEKNGIVHRTQADAFMYAHDFQAAARSYALAQSFMPQDEITRFRRELAVDRATGVDGNLYFPSSNSCFVDKLEDPRAKLHITDDSQRLISVNRTEVISVRCIQGSPAVRCQRMAGAGQVVASWCAENRLLVQEANHYEYWDLDGLQMLERDQGMVLTVSKALTHIVVWRQEGVFLLDKLKGVESPLRLPDGVEPSADMKACFTPDEASIFFLLSDGQIAKLDEHAVIGCLPWPPSVPDFQTVRSFRMSGDATLYLTSVDGRFRSVNLAQQKLNFSLQLPFVPEAFAVAKRERVLLVSSAAEFGILESGGKVVFRGAGPCAMDASGRYAVAWCEGYLTLYQLTPFRRVRTWSEKIDCPIFLSIGADGRKLVSLASDGLHRVWELDEQHRVYERKLLLTPGASYESLIESFDTFLILFNQALRLFQKKQYFLSYTSVKNARVTPGFLQSPEALELQWELCRQLRRGELEAVWERLFAHDIVASSMVEGSQVLLLAEKHSWTVRRLGSAGGATFMTQRTPFSILGCSYRQLSPTSEVVMAVAEDGTVRGYDLKSGGTLEPEDLGLGTFRRAVALKDSFFLISDQNVAAFYDLSTRRLTSTFPLKGLGVKASFPLSLDLVVLDTESGVAKMDMKKGNVKLGFLAGTLPAEARLTHASEVAGERLWTAGFSDGTIVVADQRSAKVLFSFNHAKGPVTDVQLNIKMGFGVSVSSTGGMVVFDLTNGAVFERFTAHSAPLCSVHLDSEGRYIRTITTTGELRLWELSWFLTEQKGPPVLGWMPTGAIGLLGKVFRLGSP